MMSSPSEIIILCEDKLQKVFVQRFLKRGWGIDNRRIRSMTNFSGSGEYYVRRNYPYQLTAYRDRSKKARTILIVVIDADAQTVEERHRELEACCMKPATPVEIRKTHESVMHVIPKRHIETWLAYLDDVNPNEDVSYKQRYEFKHCESDCHRLVDKLADACKKKQILPNLPRSLADACREFERIRKA